MPDVHGIPQAKEFKTRIGRTGISSITKKKDPIIDNILRYLQNAEYWRDQMNVNGLPPLRQLRKECISWIAANPATTTRAARPHILALLDAVHARITVMVESIYANTDHKTPAQRWGMLAKMNNIGSGLYTADAKGVVTRGGRVGKRLNEGYLVERVTGSHAPKMNFDAGFTKYKLANSRLKFETWVQQVLIPQSDEDPMGVYFQNDGRVGNTANLKKTERVKYCDEVERRDYVITITGGLVKDAGGAHYHTGNKQTHFSGQGWAIYVVGMDNTFYSNSHIVNEFHHSSFLSGAPVQGAGEIAVNNGKVVAVTNKTGHYTAGPAELTRTLFLLHQGGVKLDEILVNDPFKAKDVWISGLECLRAGGDFTGFAKGATPAKVPV